MRFLTPNEGVAWLAGQRFHAHDSPEVYLTVVPDTSGKRTALARLLVSFLRSEEIETAIHVTGFGIWGSHENRELYQVVRAALGDTRLLHEAPWHVFAGVQRQQAECILDLGLYFYWDMAFYLPEDECVVLLDHDDGLSVRTEGMKPTRILDAFRDFGLQEYVRTR